MSLLNAFRASALRVSCNPFAPSVNDLTKRFRKPSPCDVCLCSPDQKPCFSLRNVTIERGNQCHAKLIRAFLYEHYWSREPTIQSLWMSIHAEYLKLLTNKYSYTGDRFLALETIDRTKERRVVGVLVANKIWPWEPDELEEWAHSTLSVPERNRMYFTAHCYRSPDLFRKHKVSYIYEVEVLVTAPDVTGHGVGTLLLKTALDHAWDARHPLVQLVAVSSYANKICSRLGMKKEWSMAYSDYVDDAGQRVFFPRRPHLDVIIYTKKGPK